MRPFCLVLCVACQVPSSKDTGRAGEGEGEPGAETGSSGESGLGDDTGASHAETSDTAETSDGAEDTGPRDTGDPSTQYVADSDALWSVSAYKAGFDLAAEDLDGDGADELLIPNFFYDTSGYSSDVYAYVVPGATALASSRKGHAHRDGVVVLEDDLELAGDCAVPLIFGSVGDIDGDGLPEVAFPQPTCGEGPFVFSGATLSTTGFPGGEAMVSDADLAVEGPYADEYADLWLTALGAPSSGGTLQVSESVYLETGVMIWLFPTPVTEPTLSLDDASAKISVSRDIEPSGEVDIDGDGVPELVDRTCWQITELDSSDPMTWYLFDVPPDGGAITDEEARVTITDPSSCAGYTSPLLLPGDVDGDGLDDVVVAYASHNPTAEAGCYGVIGGLTSLGMLSGPSDLDDAAVWSVLGGRTRFALGIDAAMMPDVDGDGMPEVFASARADGTDSAYENAYEVFESSLWSAGGTYSESDARRTYLSVESDDADWQVAAGDLDGDGDPELMIEEYDFDIDGGAYIFSW